MECDGEDEDDGDYDSGDVKGDQGVGPEIPAGEHRGVGEFNQEDVDDPHSRQEQGLDGYREAEEDGYGEVGEHAGEEDVVREEAETMASPLGVTHLYHLPSLQH